MIGEADWCEECRDSAVIVDEFTEQVGFEEQAREVYVVALSCGHDVVTDRGRR